MKKLLALALAATMVFSLTACGSKAPAETDQNTDTTEDTAKDDTTDESADSATGESTSITLWTYPVGGWGDQAQVDQIIANFNAAHPEISVTVDYLDYTNGDDQVNTAIEGGQAPDLVLEGPERLVANWGAKGYMVDLAELFDTQAAGELYESVSSACKSPDGAYYEYPLCMVAHCMAINKDMFEKADALQYIDEETHTWSTENFFKAVQALYDSGQKNVAAVYCGGQGGDQGTRALINNLYNGTFTNPEHTAYTVNSPENIKALEELYAQDGINFDAGIVGGDELDLFRKDQLAMAFCWNAAQQTNADNSEAGKTVAGAEIIPMQFPTDDGKAELCGGIWGFGIFDNGDAAKIDAAKTFIDFVCNDETQGVESVKASTFFPVRPTMTGVYDGTDNADTMKIFEEDFLPAMGDYYQVVPGWAEARTAWWNMLQLVGNGDDVASCVESFESDANAAAGAN